MFCTRNGILISILKRFGSQYIASYDRPQAWKDYQLSLCIALSFEPSDLELLVFNLHSKRCLSRISIVSLLVTADLPFDHSFAFYFDNMLSFDGSYSYFKVVPHDLLSCPYFRSSVLHESICSLFDFKIDRLQSFISPAHRPDLQAMSS